jgi:hypothetical protein
MTQPEAEQGVVRFIPSKVEGAAGVVEAALFPDRVELRGERGTKTVHYTSIVPKREPTTVFDRLFRFRPPPPCVAAVFYSRQHYASGFVRLLTDPPITLYMPVEGPTQFPDSVFSRILKVIRSGGYGYYDADSPPKAHEDPHAWAPRILVTVWQGFALLAFINFFSFLIVGLCLRGSALEGRVENDRYFVGKRYLNREVSRSVWLFSWWHAVTALGGLGVLGAASLGIEAVSQVRERRARKRSTASGGAAS